MKNVLTMRSAGVMVIAQIIKASALGMVGV